MKADDDGEDRGAATNDVEGEDAAAVTEPGRWNAEGGTGGALTSGLSGGLKLID